MCSKKLQLFTLLLISASAAQGLVACSRCVHISECPLVVRIVESHPFSEHSFFFAAVSCGYGPYDTLVCCDPRVVHEALAAEADVAEAHRSTFDDVIGFYREPFNLGDRTPRPEQYANQVDDVAAGSVIQRLQQQLETDSSVYRVNMAVCGSNTTYRIIGGEAAPVDVFPWMARLGYRVRGSVNEGEINYRCGGALITARYVLTAAHCVVMLPQFTYLAVVKLGTEGVQTQTLAVAHATPHPDYERPRLQNDIGLVRLTRNAAFSDIIMPICLPFGKYSVDLTRLPPRTMLVASYGTTNPDSNALSPSLQYVRLTYQPHEECRQIYRTRFNLTISDAQICTVGERDRDSCGGDSGGPVFVWDGSPGGARAVGLVSFGARRCGTEGVPTVYTRVDRYQSWIEENIVH